MADSDKNENNAVKMQKLRRAVERLRNIRTNQDEPAIRKKSWLERLKARLGLGNETETEA
ncbi:MAG: hypothetical protein JXA33_12985 [Anaerolineae bacterium]|nr:hypothetical protein [Anaerolineae bacterium]